MKQLSSQVDELKAQRAQAKSAYLQLQDEAAQMQGKDKDLAKENDNLKDKAKGEESELKSLHAQVADLSVQGQRADALAQDLAGKARLVLLLLLLIL